MSKAIHVAVDGDYELFPVPFGAQRVNVSWPMDLTANGNLGAPTFDGATLRFFGVKTDTFLQTSSPATPIENGVISAASVDSDGYGAGSLDLFTTFDYFFVRVSGYDKSGSISGITKANPAVVTYTGSDVWKNGDLVDVSAVVGMTQVNGNRYTIANVNTGAKTFELAGINSTGFSTYTSGGTLTKIHSFDMWVCPA